MMGAALRNRGMDYLFGGDLEQGLYDLALAERFGPLDNQAASWRRSAVFYQYANSYFGLDWELAAENFSQLCVANIWGACYKYAFSAAEYGKLLTASEEHCRASYYYGESLTFYTDASLAPVATEAAEICLTQLAPSPTVTPTLATGTPDGTATVTPAALTATPTQGASPTPSRTPGPATSTPTPTQTVPPTPTNTQTQAPTPTPTPTS
jgi:hypothetical protein